MPIFLENKMYSSKEHFATQTFFATGHVILILSFVRLYLSKYDKCPGYTHEQKIPVNLDNSGEKTTVGNLFREVLLYRSSISNSMRIADVVVGASFRDNGIRILIRLFSLAIATNSDLISLFSFIWKCRRDLNL